MAVRQQTPNRIKGYQKMHAKQRALQRFGIRLTPEDYDNLVAMITVTGMAQLVKKLTNTRAVFSLDFQGQKLLALYNSKTKRIVTFLTKEQLKDHGIGQ